MSARGLQQDDTVPPKIGSGIVHRLRGGGSRVFPGSRVGVPHLGGTSSAPCRPRAGGARRMGFAALTCFRVLFLGGSPRLSVCFPRPRHCPRSGVRVSVLSSDVLCGSHSTETAKGKHRASMPGAWLIRLGVRYTARYVAPADGRAARSARAAANVTAVIRPPPVGAVASRPPNLRFVMPRARMAPPGWWPEYRPRSSLASLARVLGVGAIAGGSPPTPPLPTPRMLVSGDRQGLARGVPRA
jgi:hypothetical protein